MTIREFVNIDMAITAHLRIYLDEMYDEYTYKNAPVYNDFFSKSKLNELNDDILDLTITTITTDEDGIVIAGKWEKTSDGVYQIIHDDESVSEYPTNGLAEAARVCMIENGRQEEALHVVKKNK